MKIFISLLTDHFPIAFNPKNPQNTALVSPVYQEPFELFDSTTLKVIAVDQAGNQTQVETMTYMIDQTAPTLTISPDGGFKAQPQVVQLECHDIGGSQCADIFFSTDGTKPTNDSRTYVTPLELNQSAEVRAIVG